MPPDGLGTITFTAKATGADRVEFTPTPTGTEPLTAHFGIRATGPGGTTEVTPINPYHD